MGGDDHGQLIVPDRVLAWAGTTDVTGAVEFANEDDPRVGGDDGPRADHPGRGVG